jgi:hypothetical protein
VAVGDRQAPVGRLRGVAGASASALRCLAAASLFSLGATARPRPAPVGPGALCLLLSLFARGPLGGNAGGMERTFAQQQCLTLPHPLSPLPREVQRQPKQGDAHQPRRSVESNWLCERLRWLGAMRLARHRPPARDHASAVGDDLYCAVRSQEATHVNARTFRAGSGT